MIAWKKALCKLEISQILKIKYHPKARGCSFLTPTVPVWGLSGFMDPVVGVKLAHEVGNDVEYDFSKTTQEATTLVL